MRHATTSACTRGAVEGFLQEAGRRSQSEPALATPQDLCPECTAWHIAEERKSPTLPVSFIGQEEKRLVARYGSAQRSAELIQAKRRLRRSRHPRRLLRVKDTVAQKLERVSVPLIRAR